MVAFTGVIDPALKYATMPRYFKLTPHMRDSDVRL